mgnify:CR=1 FL=1
MRFGSRIGYECKAEVDPNRVMVPAFTLQPVVENAIIHGLSKKEQGGKIVIRIWRTGGSVIISVADTGVGMDEETLDQIAKVYELVVEAVGGHAGQQDLGYRHWTWKYLPEN